MKCMNSLQTCNIDLVSTAKLCGISVVLTALRQSKPLYDFEVKKSRKYI